MVPVGFDMIEQLDAAAMPESILDRSLRSLGFLAGDVFRVGDPLGQVCAYEIGCDSRMGTCDRESATTGKS
jgi:hypothetical protein